MPKLIALVATAVIVNGERTVIQPGEPLPEDLPAHDAKELTGSGAAEDVAQSMREARKDELAELAAQEEFQKARQKQLAEQESIKPTDATTGKPAVKQAANKAAK